MTEKLVTRVVVVGGGLSGLMCTIHLVRKAPSTVTLDITLIEKKEYYEYIPASLRCMVTPSHFEKVSVPLEDFHRSLMKGSRHRLYLFTRCQAVGLDTTNHVVKYCRVENTSEELQVAYDYLVLACGSDYIAPYIKPSESDRSLDDRMQSFKHFKDSLLLEDMKHALIVGGGSVGVELAGELVDFRKQNNKTYKITLVHSRDILLERCGEKMHNYCNTWLSNQSVELILGDRVNAGNSYDYSQDLDLNVSKSFVTQKGTNIDNVSMVFWCHSCKPATAWIKNSVDMDERGNVKVNASLQSVSHPNVFAIGDISSFDCEKTAGNARDQGDVVGKIILSIITHPSSDHNKLTTFSTKGFLMNVSLGFTDGAFVYGTKMVLWGRLCAFSKRKIEYIYGVKPIKYP